MDTVIRKWGNSPAVRLPKALLSTAHMDVEQAVRVTAEEGRIIIEPRSTVAYSLAQLVAGIEEGNTHAAVDFGPARGKESF
jgi:antitoxin MazE